MKNQITEATKNHLKDCDKKGLPDIKNISQLEEKGIKYTKKDKENVILNTDKSGWLAAQKKGIMLKE